MEYEVDLRKYVLAIVRRGHWIAALILLTALTAAGISMVLPKTYIATTSILVVIRQTGSQLGINEPFVSIETIDIQARRQGLASLALNKTVESLVPLEIRQRVIPNRYRMGMLVDEGFVGVDFAGDLLNIRVQAPSPQQAKELADAWTEAYLSQVNRLYTDEHSHVQLVGEAALPYEPIARPTSRNVVLAGISAGLVGVTLAVLAEIVGPQLLLVSGRFRRKQPLGKPSPTQ